jgi:hypothetical protein
MILAGLILAGCSVKQSMSLESFRGLCLAGGGEKNSGCSSMDICYPLADQLEQEPGSLGHCLEICRDYAAGLSAQSVMNRCAPLLSGAEILCIKYCRINYEP